MAWNGSGKGGTSAVPKKPVKAKHQLALGKGALAGVLVVAITAVVAFFLMPSEKPVAKADEPKAEKKVIADHTPAEVSEKTEEGVHNVDSGAVQDSKPVKLTRSQLRDLRNNRRAFTPPAYTSTVSRVSHEASLFDNRAEQTIASLLAIEPGEGIVGDAEDMFGPRFMKALADSSVNKIVVNPDDSDYDREVKTQVAEVKRELFERIKGGEDAKKIMVDTFNEIQQLGLYKQELERLVRSSIHDGALSDEDVQDTLVAANKMLAERGVSEMKMPAMFKGRMRILQRRYNGGTRK